MLSVDAILTLVREAGGRLEPAESDRIAFVGPPEVLTGELRAAIRANRDELLDRLRPKTAAELVAAVCDLGCWLVLRDGEIQVRRHEGAPPLPGDLLERIQTHKEALAAFMQKPVASYTVAEREALGLSRTFGSDWPGFAWWESPGA